MLWISSSDFCSAGACQAPHHEPKQCDGRPVIVGLRDDFFDSEFDGCAIRDGTRRLVQVMPGGPTLIPSRHGREM
jgi:hypothetical protein